MKAKLFLIFILFSVLVFAAQKVELLGDRNYAPYVFEKGGKLHGIYVDILNKAFENMPNYEVHLKPVPWKRGVDMVKKGKALGIFAPYYHPTKRPYVNPYSEPLYKEKVVVVARKSVMNTARKNWPADFYNLKAGVNIGFNVGGEDFVKAVADGNMTKEEVATTDQCLLMLGKGRLDLYINDEIAIMSALKDLKAKGKIAGSDEEIVTAVTVSEENAYIGYSKPYKATWKNDFIKKLDIELKKLHKNGTVQKIVDSYK